jgi:lysine 6-dehydrogenase
MKAAIVGTGRMGKAIAWAMDKLGCTELVLVDSVMDSLSACAEGLSCSTESILSDVQEPNPAFLKDSDIVISSLPYYHNEKLARHCIDHQLPYCDLGGHISTSNGINEYAKNKGSVVMTDLGLAPGWVNILAERGYNSHDDLPETIEMLVGGLPIKPSNYLKYSCTWSHDGLINEYKDQCEVLINGFNTLADGMSGLTDIKTSLGVMEAFYTSGGASHTIKTMQKRGVQNCCYKTIRHKGHCEALKFLIHDCGLDDKGLIALLNTACPPAPDLVIVKVRVGDYKNIADWREEKIVYSNDKFSAMQMATAFPISVAAYLIGTGDFNGPLAYKDIPYEEFETKLNRLFEEVG